MNNACPRCGKTYHLTPRHVGRRIPCKRCGAPLVVREDGIHLGSAETSAAGREESPAEILRDAGFFRSQREVRSASLSDSLAADLGTWLFVGGMVLLIFAVVLGLIDQAAVARAQARLKLVDVEFRSRNEILLREDDAAKRAVLETKKAYEELAAAEAKEAKGKESEPLAQAQEKYKQAVEAEQKKRAELEHQLSLWRIERQRKAQDAAMEEEADAAMNRYWYSWLALPGLIALLVGCIGFLGSDSLCRKLTATIVLTFSMVALVLFYFGPLRVL